MPCYYAAVDAAMAATGPDTITKFLFTSGSTKLPKAVINTQRMWCANQQQMAQSMPALTQAPYVQDVVLTGINLKEVGAMVFPTPAVRALSGLGADASLADVLCSAPVLAHFQNVLNTLAASATGNPLERAPP